MNELMSVIILWLSAIFGLPQTSEFPQVRHVPSEQIAVMHDGRSVLGDSVVAVYDSRIKTIFLPEDWSSRNVADISTLVHEMVHHLQYLTGKKYACPAERESLAYAAQERWLEMFGEDLESAFGITAMTLKLRTTCMFAP